MKTEVAVTNFRRLDLCTVIHLHIKNTKNLFIYNKYITKLPKHNELLFIKQTLTTNCRNLLHWILAVVIAIPLALSGWPCPIYSPIPVSTHLSMDALISQPLLEMLPLITSESRQTRWPAPVTARASCSGIRRASGRLRASLLAAPVKILSRRRGPCRQVVPCGLKL